MDDNRCNTAAYMFLAIDLACAPPGADTPQHRTGGRAMKATMLALVERSTGVLLAANFRPCAAAPRGSVFGAFGVIAA